MHAEATIYEEEKFRSQQMLHCHCILIISVHKCSTIPSKKIPKHCRPSISNRSRVIHTTVDLCLLWERVHPRLDRSQTNLSSHWSVSDHVWLSFRSISGTVYIPKCIPLNVSLYTQISNPGLFSSACVCWSKNQLKMKCRHSPHHELIRWNKVTQLTIPSYTLKTVTDRNSSCDYKDICITILGSKFAYCYNFCLRIYTIENLNVILSSLNINLNVTLSYLNII